MASVRTETEQAASALRHQNKDGNPKQGPMFDAMIKTFSQKAYINDGGDLSLAPPVNKIV